MQSFQLTEGYSNFRMGNLWANYKSIPWRKKTGEIIWKMRPNLRLDALEDNDYVYVEVEALYDYNSSNLWELHTEIVIILYNCVTLQTIEMKRNCCFDNRSGFKFPIRFEFGRLGTFRDSIAPSEGDLKNLVFDMITNVIDKSTVGMHIPPTDHFLQPENNENTEHESTEVVLRFLESEKPPFKFYIDRLALTTVSSKFREIFSNEPDNWEYLIEESNNSTNFETYTIRALTTVSSKFCDIFSNEPNNNEEFLIENIYNSTNFEKYTFRVRALIHFFRLLYRRKQKFTSGTIEGILYLAVRYDIQFLIADCEDFLISSREISNAKKLCIAEECNLSKLQLVALKKIKIEFFGKVGLRIFKEFHQMGTKTLKALLVMFCEEDYEPYN